ncbi:MAG: septum formation protein Maf [Bacillaceae bacterium G1]|nr:septum formation protein Maf [Bacillota bacterium]OJF16610.1 MAG: septum formation protein Maf [Bacillaceae bacterium G1]
MGLQPRAEVILASGSPRRKELLASVGIRFAVCVPDVDETMAAHWSPAEAVEQLAYRKGRAVVEQLVHRRAESPVTVASEAQARSRGSASWTDADAMTDGAEVPVLVIAADTVVVLDGEVMGKPSDAEEAVRMLQRLSGRQHEVFSGLALFCLDSRSEASPKIEHRLGHVRTEVRFRPLSEDTIRRYVATGEPLDKAGAYAIQGLGATLVEGITGDYFNVVGLPLALLGQYLEDWGYRLF